MRFLWSLMGAGFRRRDIRGRLRLSGSHRGFEDWLESRRFNLRRTIIHKWRDESFVLPGILGFELERLHSFASGSLRAFGVAPPHDRGVEPLLDDGASARLDDGFLAQDRLAMRLFVEVALHPIRFFGTEQTASECAWASFKRSALAITSSRGTPHSLARLLIRLRAILSYFIRASARYPAPSPTVWPRRYEALRRDRLRISTSEIP